jgi:DNA-directed RNA polymerase alpha subunit
MLIKYGGCLRSRCIDLYSRIENLENKLQRKLLLRKKVSELGLSAWIPGVLRKAGLKTVSGLIKKTELELVLTKGLDRDSVNEIIETLRKINWKANLRLNDKYPYRETKIKDPSKVKRAIPPFSWILELRVRRLKQRIAKLQKEFDEENNLSCDDDAARHIAWLRMSECHSLERNLKSCLEDLQKRLPRKRLLKKDISELNLPTRPLSLLREAGINTFGDLVEKTKWDLYDLFRAKDLDYMDYARIIIIKLDKFGLKLKG